MSDEQPTIGQQLAAARETAGLSVDDVSEQTRVRAAVIRAIESDDFGPSGGDFYARGHIRSIASVVGTDAAPLIARFDEERQPQGPDVTEVFEHEASGRRLGRRGPNWTAVMGAALLAAIVLIGYQVFTTAGQPKRGSGTVAQPTPTPVVSITPTPTPSNTDSAVAQASPTEVVLSLRTLPGKRAWVSVSNPSGQIFQGTLVGGQSKTFRDPKRLSLVVGDASAISLTVNGTKMGVMGGPGDVIQQSFGPNDPAGSSG